MAQKIFKPILVTLSKGEKNRGSTLLDTTVSKHPFLLYDVCEILHYWQPRYRKYSAEDLIANFKPDSTKEVYSRCTLINEDSFSEQSWCWFKEKRWQLLRMRPLMAKKQTPGEDGKYLFPVCLHFRVV